MKHSITWGEWKNLEKILMRANIGYNVIFDNHHGMVEMLIDVNTISIMRKEEDN